jgi:hypothetical protein
MSGAHFPETAFETECSPHSKTSYRLNQLVGDVLASPITGVKSENEDSPNFTIPGLPSGLKTLIIHDRIALGLHTLFKATPVPNSLTVLRVAHISIPPEIWSLLPRSLSEFQIHGFNPLSALPIHQFGLLRRIELRMGMERVFELPQMPSTLLSFSLASRGALEQTCLMLFPKGMTELTLEEIGTPRTLDLDGFRILSSWTQLKRLYLSMQMPSVTDEMFRLLPRSLLSLKLTGKAGSLLTGSFFQHLPRFLQTLHMHGPVTVNNRHAILLPRTLRRLHLEKVSKMTYFCLPLMPTTLVSAFVEDLEITHNTRWLRLVRDYEISSPDSRVPYNSFLFQSDATLASLDGSPLLKKREQNRSMLQSLGWVLQRHPTIAGAVGLPIVLSAFVWLWQRY